LLGWLLPWLLIALVVGIAIWFLVSAIGGDEVAPPVADRSPSPTESAEPSPSETEIVLATPKPTRSKAPKPKPTRTKEPKDLALITEGINIQVLNGTGDTAVDDAVADALSALGFRIEAMDDSSKAYARTTVFWSYPEAQEAAERLAARRGWIAQPKPENLSDTVALHVVVGEDEL
jgi:hypothetical protein